MSKEGALILEDGTRYEGRLFGAENAVAGEVVFSTAMTGYTESLSDPSFAGQILVSTYPIVGNYGFPSDEKEPSTGLSKFLEGDTLYPKAFIVHDYTDGYSHWNAVESLSEAMRRHNVTGLFGIDTRALTKKLRDQGPLIGKVVTSDEEDIPFVQSDEINLVAEVSTKEVITYGNGVRKIVLIDCGVKHNIIRHLLQRGLTIYRVPWDYDFRGLDYDGIFISNGPGDPRHCEQTIQYIREAIDREIPTAGICMGNQILALAIGASVRKMKYGHRSQNQPVQMVGSDRCFITSQNHGFAVDDSHLPQGWRPFFTNLNDGSNEGLIHDSGKFFSVQFHPEACGGPTDTTFIFDKFVEILLK